MQPMPSLCGTVLAQLALLALLLSLTSAAPLVYDTTVAHDIPRPWSVTLLGETCYTTLIQQAQWTHRTCLKYALSKVLGLGIVMGSAIIKVPQIITIVRMRSAQGVSLASYWLETLSYCIVLVYNVRQDNPFSTFGEVVFMTAQNITITLLILIYAERRGEAMLASVAFLCIFQWLSWIGSSVLAGLYAMTIPLVLASKVPQIYANYLHQSTGQLSVFAVVNYFAGTTARVFTTLTELEDPLMLTGNLLASVLNGVLLVQVWRYWGCIPEKADKVK